MINNYCLLYLLLILSSCCTSALYIYRHLRPQMYWDEDQLHESGTRWTKHRTVWVYWKTNFDMACELIKLRFCLKQILTNNMDTSKSQWIEILIFVLQIIKIIFSQTKIKTDVLSCNCELLLYRHKFRTGVFYRLPCTDIS